MDDNTKWIIVGIIVAVIIIGIIISNKISDLKKKIVEKDLQAAHQEGAIRESDLLNERKLSDKDLEIEKMIASAKEIANNIAQKQFADWKEKELETHRKVIFDVAVERAQAMLAEWKISTEKGFRQDAVTRSMGVNFGKITEHLVPFSEHLQTFDPRDVRFIGSPVDLMIFDGATQKKSTIDIYFVEIKTGTGQLSKKQKTIRDAIEGHRVHWKPIIVPAFKWDVADEDEENGEEPFPEL
ncbi:MAG TPA: Holliday junction resolvase-like protein [Chitinophagaceae bacterium]